MGEKDIAEKILESYNDVFSDIINGLLFDGEQIVQPDELIDQTPRSAYKADGRVREIERDVAKLWTKQNIQIAFLGLENQTQPDAFMPLRVYGYDGAGYRAQLVGENVRLPRHPVVTLVLYFGANKRWDAPTTLYEAVNVPDMFRPFVPDIKINLFEIAFLTHEQVSRFRSDFRIVADYFVQTRENGDYIPSPETLTHVQETLHLLSVMTKDHRFEDVYNDNAGKGEVHNMCEVLDRIEQRGEQRGIRLGEQRGIRLGEERGIRLGEERGLKLGAESKAKAIAIAMHKRGTAPSEIAEILGEPLQKVQQWLGIQFA